MEELNILDRDDRARILMCAPEHFAVTYTINPWMDPAEWAKKKAQNASAWPRAGNGPVCAKP